MAVDDSFKKPGAVPFKWEIKPGVPRIQHQQQKCEALSAAPPQPPLVQPYDHHRSSELSLPKLKPPPAGCYAFPSPVEPRTRSFRSTPRVRSARLRFEQPLISRPDSVSTGCLFSPLIKRIPSKRVIRRPVIEPEDDDDNYTSDLETLTRWSLSSRKSFSPFRGSSSPSSMSSRWSSPRTVGDVEWAGFGLF